MFNCSCAPVPARARDLIRSAAAGVFAFTESRHAAQLPLHAHPSWTLSVLLAGGFEERYAGARTTQHCGDFAVLLREPGELHADRFAAAGAHVLVLEFPDAFIKRAGPLAIGKDALTGAALEVMSRSLHRELLCTDSGQALALEGLALQLLATLVRAASVRGEDDLVARAQALLAARFRESELRIGELASQLDIHPVALARAFRARVGTSPGDYLRGLRLAWARGELAASARPLAAIALAAGFADQSHFTRAFRQRFGVTPARFRGDQARPQGSRP